MTPFFVRTDRAVVGPFTGIELREAALAGILRHDSVVGGAAEGPWFLAADVGLFSDNQTPLPHPAGTVIPQYQVRGMPGAFQGPFKLRELIGFAARGMLPGGALLQSNRASDWIPVRRIHVLSACLDGHLVLIDSTGKVVLRAAATESQAAAAGEARAPIEVAKAASTTDATMFASELAGDEADPITTQLAGQASSETAVARGPSKLAQLWSRIELPEWARDLRISIPPRLALQLVCLLLLFAGVASAFSYWKQIGLSRDRVIGDWIGVAAEGAEHPAFGLSLRPDGQCVILNASGDSWTGDYVWEERSDDQSGMESVEPFSTVIGQISPEHQAGAVKPTDGYIRLQGFVKDPPMIDRQPVRDLFLRREGNRLRIGYIASVHWTAKQRTIEAGWLDAIESQAERREIAVELSALEQTPGIPAELFRGEIPLHLSEAIDAVRRGIPSPSHPTETSLHECLAYSAIVTPGYLLAEFGMPDEARRIYRFEIPPLRGGPSFAGAQVVRYGELKFVFSPDGDLLYLVLAPTL